MAVSKRKIGIYSVTGILAASLLIVLIFASGLQIPFGSNNQGQTGSNTGTIVVSIKDAPVDLKELWITIDSLYVQSAQDDKWVELSLDSNQPVTFDLLTLQDTSLKLSQDTISIGTYSKIRLGVTEAIATYTDNKEVLHEDEELKIPPGHIDIITSFEVGENQVTGLLIDMQPDTAAISQSGNFKPILKMTITQETSLTTQETSLTPSPSPTESLSPSPSITT
jgi:hypothetical protein